MIPTDARPIVVLAIGVVGGIGLYSGWLELLERNLMQTRIRAWLTRRVPSLVAFALCILVGVATSITTVALDDQRPRIAALQSALFHSEHEVALLRAEISDRNIQLGEVRDLQARERRGADAISSLISEIEQFVQRASSAEVSVAACPLAQSEPKRRIELSMFFAGKELDSAVAYVGQHCVQVATPADITSVIVVFADGTRFDVGDGRDPGTARHFIAYGTETLVVDGVRLSRVQVYAIWSLASGRRILGITEIDPAQTAPPASH